MLTNYPPKFPQMDNITGYIFGFGISSGTLLNIAPEINKTLSVVICLIITVAGQSLVKVIEAKTKSYLENKKLKLERKRAAAKK
jgi:hypothetical protein